MLHVFGANHASLLSSAGNLTEAEFWKTGFLNDVPFFQNA